MLRLATSGRLAYLRQDLRDDSIPSGVARLATLALHVDRLDGLGHRHDLSGRERLGALRGSRVAALVHDAPIRALVVHDEEHHLIAAAAFVDEDEVHGVLLASPLLRREQGAETLGIEFQHKGYCVVGMTEEP